MKKLSRPFLAASAVVLAVTLAGCGSSTAEVDSPGGDSLTSPSLDPGPYPVSSRPESGSVADETAGRVIEGLRMAQYVSLPVEIDEIMVEQHGASSGSLDGTDTALSTVSIIGEEGGRAVSEAGLIAGFQSNASVESWIRGADGKEVGNPDMRTMNHIVMRFRDESAAEAGADALVDSLLVPREGLGTAEVGQINVMPNSRIVRLTMDPTERYASDSTEAVTAVGDYVIYTYASALPEHIDWTAKAVAKALAAQEPLLEQYDPTPLNEIASLPADPTGLVRFTVPQGSNTKYRQPTIMALGPRGIAHFSEDSNGTLASMTKAGVSSSATDLTRVMRAETEAQAEDLMSWTVAAYDTDAYTKAHSPTGLPQVPCFLSETSSGDFTECIVHSGTFVATISPNEDAQEVRKLATAQYMILEAAK